MSFPRSVPVPRRFWPALVIAVGVVALVTGVVTLQQGGRDLGQQGWFAYAPLSDSVFRPRQRLFTTTSDRVGLALSGLGLVLISGSAGYLIGRRKRSGGGAGPAESWPESA